MRRYYEEMKNAEPIKIGHKIKVKIKEWAGTLVPETKSVYQDRHVNGESSVRIYKIPEKHSFIIGDEIEGTVAGVNVASRMTLDWRKKIYVNLENPERVYSPQTYSFNGILHITIKSGDNILSHNEFPGFKIMDAYVATKIEISSEVQLIISDQGTPQPEFMKRSDDIGDISIRTYRFNEKESHNFKKGELIKARVESVSVGHNSVFSKWEQISITLRNPKRVYYYSIVTTEQTAQIMYRCGDRIKTRTIHTAKESFEAIYGNNIYQVTKIISKHDGRLLHMHYEHIASAESQVRQKFANLKSVMPRAGDEHIRRLRKIVRDLPQLEQDPRQHGDFDFFAERNEKKHRNAREKEILAETISGAELR